MKDSKLDKILSVIVIFLFLLLLWLLFGCTATKKIQTEVKETQYINERTTEYTVSETSKSVDTTKVSSVESNTFKVEYFNPNEVDNYATILQMMRDRNEPYSEYGIPKSISGSITRTNETQSGVSEEAGKTAIDTQKASNIETKREEKTVVKTEPFFAKYKWYLIAASAIIIGIGEFFIAKKVNLKKFFLWAK